MPTQDTLWRYDEGQTFGQRGVQPWDTSKTAAADADAGANISLHAFDEKGGPHIAGPPFRKM